MEEKQIVKTVLENCRDLEGTIQTILKRFGEIHNIAEDKNIFAMKQEVIARTAYFLEKKKKYALYIINKEGVDCEEYDIKGVELRRSDYPSYTKEKLQILLDYLVKNEGKISFKQIREFIETTREEILEMCKNGDKRIAKPVSYGRSEEEYKVVPSHIIGMELWNVFEYNYFVPGSKGYHFNVKGINTKKAPDRILNNLDKFKIKNTNIVLPNEEERLPDYYLIDIDAQIQFSWDDRVEHLIAPIKSKIFKKSKKSELYAF